MRSYILHRDLHKKRKYRIRAAVQDTICTKGEFYLAGLIDVVVYFILPIGNKLAVENGNIVQMNSFSQSQWISNSIVTTRVFDGANLNLLSRCMFLYLVLQQNISH